MTDKIKITLPDSSKKSYEKGITAEKVAFDIGERLGKAALAAKIDGSLADLNTKISKDCKLEIVTFDSDEGKEIFHHSSSHILAQAVLSLFPDAKPTIGPAIADGFYYDFDKKEPFTPEDVKKIEAKMQEIINRDLRFERKEITKQEAKKLFKDNAYKLEMIEEIDKTSVYRQGNFIDLCRGPHVPSTGRIKAFKILKIAGAYWRGDAKNRQLQRIYGISFPDKKELDKFLSLREEAEKRDHRKIGKELDLFSFHEEGAGFPFWHQKGMILRDIIVDYWKEVHKKAGYEEVNTPIILNRVLWEKSGHWEHYRKSMYFTKIDEQDYAVKPMNCPGCVLIYKTKLHSYKEFPIKMAELGLVHRHELAGVIHGLFRVRCFVQDDAHIFCLPEQIEDEIKNIIDLTFKVYKTFGFNDCEIELSTRPEKDFMGTVQMWDKAEKALKNVLEDKKIGYKLNKGEGAFYGPKIDFHIKDCMARKWQCGTIQLDFAMPQTLDLVYMGKDGTTNHRPVMIHRTILGSLERFIGVLIEHYAGKLPLWLAPVQARIITVSEKFESYAKKVLAELKENNIRAELDDRDESIPRKVRDAQLQKVLLILTVGEKEKEADSVAVRTLDGKVKMGYKIDKFIKDVLKNVEEKKERFVL